MHSAAGFHIIARRSARTARRHGKLPIDVAVLTQPDGLALDQQRLARGVRGAPRALVLVGEALPRRGIVTGGTPRVRERGEGRQRRLEPLTRAPERDRLLFDDLAHDLRVALRRTLVHALTPPRPRSPAIAGAREIARRSPACEDPHSHPG